MTAFAIQLPLDVGDVAVPRCLPLSVTSDGWFCHRCWLPTRPDAATRCTCATQGCYECGAEVGEPGCRYCSTPDADGFRGSSW